MKGLDTLPEASGIYIIRHDASGREYVGQAVNVRARAQQHVRDLSRGKRRGLFQSCWNKHGPDAFSIRVAELVEPVKELLDAAEQHYLDTDGFAFNILRVAGSMLGYRLSEAQKVNHQTKRPEVRAKLRDAFLGDTNPSKRPEVREAMSAAMNRPEVRAKISAKVKARLAANPEAHPMNRPEVREARRGDANPIRRPEIAAKHRAAIQARWAEVRALQAAGHPIKHANELKAYKARLQVTGN